MNIKKSIGFFGIGLTVVFMQFSCKSKISDSDLKAKVEKAIQANPNVTVAVNESVVTLSGNVSSEASKVATEQAARDADSKHIKSVVNAINVVAPVTQNITINTSDSDLANKLVDAVKDYPTVTASAKDGIITVSGTIEQSRVQVLKQSLDALNPKRVDLSGLTIK
ncbi:BON domain-containing protein [Sphingobacterium sp. Mn56C]|uniref:BON domain-containing protein n=1 Tax=Sphingobacterium sp. Mn56C TaxID=3395261 RepID=UPI003BCD402A